MADIILAIIFFLHYSFGFFNNYLQKKITTIEKNTDLQNKICQRLAPSNDLTISPPKLKLTAPKKTRKGPGKFLIKFIKF